MDLMGGEPQTPTDKIVDDGIVFQVTIQYHHDLEQVIPILKEVEQHRVVSLIFELEAGIKTSTRLGLEKLIDLLCLPSVRLEVRFITPITTSGDYRKVLSDLNYYVQNINPYGDPVGLERVKLALTKCMGELYELQSEKTI